MEEAAGLLGEYVMDQIERQAAIDELTEYGYGRAVYISVEEAVRRIEQLPSAQPKIIHCKDCKWWDKQDFLQGRCALLGIRPTGGWFCANADMRGENE
jgi:hypothetical protein